MAIQEITSTELVQRCAKCDRENRIALANLEVGVERDDQVEDSVVPLPECPTCRSREFLLRSPASEQAHPAQGSSGHLHRLIVDELHSELVKKGRVVERSKRQDRAGRHASPSPPRSGPASSTRG
jgi:DNA-directed RNA polymerase subunit RPC12/RpoP